MLRACKVLPFMAKGTSSSEVPSAGSDTNQVHHVELNK